MYYLCDINRNCWDSKNKKKAGNFCVSKFEATQETIDNAIRLKNNIFYNGHVIVLVRLKWAFKTQYFPDFITKGWSNVKHVTYSRLFWAFSEFYKHKTDPDIIAHSVIFCGFSLKHHCFYYGLWTKTQWVLRPLCTFTAVLCIKLLCYSKPANKDGFKTAERIHPCEQPNTNPASILSVFPQIIPMKRVTIENTAPHDISCVYFSCILNLLSWKGSDNVCCLSVRYLQLQPHNKSSLSSNTG